MVHCAWWASNFCLIWSIYLYSSYSSAVLKRRRQRIGHHKPKRQHNPMLENGNSYLLLCSHFLTHFCFKFNSNWEKEIPNSWGFGCQKKLTMSHHIGPQIQSQALYFHSWPFPPLMCKCNRLVHHKAFIIIILLRNAGTCFLEFKRTMIIIYKHQHKHPTIDNSWNLKFWNIRNCSKAWRLEKVNSFTVENNW